MAVRADDDILDEIRRDGLGVPPASYLQRRFSLPYSRAAVLRERLAAERLAEESDAAADLAAAVAEEGVASEPAGVAEEGE